MPDTPKGPPASAANGGPLRLDVGSVIADRYEIVRIGNSGGMGQIFVGKHLLLNQRIAIKVLHRSVLTDREQVGRFAREARAAAQIRSEHVARVFDVGTLEDGAPFMVMEYLSGNDLSRTVKTEGPLPIETAVDYVLQACEAIVEAHGLGIVHRDLKPANLFLTKRADGSPLIKVLDFGISKVSEAYDATDSNLTQTSGLVGSPHFMSPEQLTAARDTDGRADIWALGVVLFNLLSGDLPFVGDTVPLIAVAVLTRKPRTLRSVKPEMPEALEEVIAKCLRQERTERYANVGELANALAPFASDGAKLSVDRIVRVATEGMAKSNSTAPAPIKAAPILAPMPVPSTLAGIAPVAGSGIAIIAPPPSRMQSDASINETMSSVAGVPRAGSRNKMITGAAIAVIAVVGLLAMFTHRAPATVATGAPANSVVPTRGEVVPPIVPSIPTAAASNVTPIAASTASAIASSAPSSAPNVPITTSAPARQVHVATPTPTKPRVAATAPTSTAAEPIESRFGGRK